MSIIQEHHHHMVSHPDRLRFLDQERYRGWKGVRMDELMKKLYPSILGNSSLAYEAAVWQDCILYGLSGSIDPIQLPGLPEGIELFALLDGATARRLYVDKKEVLEIPEKLVSSYKHTDLPADPFYRDLLLELPTMPYNTDYKVICPIEKREQVFATIQNNIGINLSDASWNSHLGLNEVEWEYNPIKGGSMRSKLNVLRHSNNVMVTKYSLAQPSDLHPFFTVDITFYPDEVGLKTDLRSGPGVSDMQNVHAYVGVDYESIHEDTIMVMNTATQFEENTKILNGPLRIANPQYQNFESAAVASIQTSRLGAIWKCPNHEYYRNRFDPETLERFPAELDRTYQNFLSNDEQISDSRAKKFIRNAVAGFTDHKNFEELIRHLGIGTVLFPEIYSNHSHDEIALSYLSFLLTNFNVPSPIAYAAFLKANGYQTNESTDWGTFCEAFDLRRLKKRA